MKKTSKSVKKLSGGLASEIAKIESILKKIRPYIQMHGGDVHFVSYENGIVTLSISGACSHCGLSDMTYNTLIAGILKEDVPGFKEVKLLK